MAIRFTPPTSTRPFRQARINPLRIIQIVQEFSRRGGVESVAYELDRLWRDAGEQVEVMACVFSEAHPAAHRIAPTLARIPTRGIGRYAGRALAMPVFAWLATRSLRRMRREHDDTVFLSHGDTLDGDVCVVHAVNRASLQAKKRQGEWRWRLNPMHAWVGLRDRLAIGGHRYRRYVAVSRRIAQELTEHYAVPPEAIEIIPNGVNLTRFSALPKDRAATRSVLGLAADAPVLLFVGHEFGRKGLAFILQALASLPKSTRLVVVGAGEIARFKSVAAGLGVEQQVLFLGPRDDLPALYRSADAFVFPTTYEAFGLVCIEAMACGLPVFATVSGGIEDYLESGVNGVAIPQDGAAIAAILQPFVEEPMRFQDLRPGALRTAERHGWTYIAGCYRRLLSTVLQERQAERLLSPSHRVVTCQ